MADTKTPDRVMAEPVQIDNVTSVPPDNQDIIQSIMNRLGSLEQALNMLEPLLGLLDKIPFLSKVIDKVETPIHEADLEIDELLTFLSNNKSALTSLIEHSESIVSKTNGV
jgi:hypothetical protein